MDALAAARATAPAVSTVTSLFMLDGATYKQGSQLGFQGLDFYYTGRGGVLGDVDAGVVAAAFAFMEPAQVRTQWQLGLSVMPARAAAEAFAACGDAWAEAHVPDDIDAARVAELAGRVADGARLACAPVFAGWRTLEVPASPAAAATHQMNALRELRHGLHAACIAAAGLAPVEAVAVKSPAMAPIFGWAELPETDDEHAATWQRAEDATNVAMAHAYEALSEAERHELVELCGALLAALTPG